MPRRDPFREIEELFDRMGREFEDLGSGIESPGGSRVRVDIAEDDDAITVTADLPGYNRDDIDVQVDDDVLTIAATHTEETESESEGEGGDEDEDTRYHRRERRKRAVSRRISLPAPVEETEASASYSNGVLTVTLPKRSSDEESHSIDVN